MALVLCQQCLSWVEPIAEQCPQCDYPIDLRAADPTLEDLAATIGPLTSVIGPVRISRTVLPYRGVLYATTGGLFFLPESVERVRLVPTVLSPGSLVRALTRIPMRILRLGTLRGAWNFERPHMRVEVFVQPSPRLGPGDGDQIPRLLMDDPGAFFFARRSIKSVRRTFSGWALVRPNNLTLRLKPLGDRAAFNEQMTALASEVLETVLR